MKLIVAPEIFSLFPNLRILVLVASLPALDAAQTAARDALIRSRWRSAWSRLASTEKPASHPNVKAFKDAMKGAGIKVSSFPPAIESLVKRVKPGSKPFEVNFLVDFYNANSLDNGGWIGLVDGGRRVADGFIMASLFPLLAFRSAQLNDDLNLISVL